MVFPWSTVHRAFSPRPAPVTPASFTVSLHLLPTIVLVSNGFSGLNNVLTIPHDRFASPERKTPTTKS